MSTKTYKDVIFREYDIRGVVGIDYNIEFAYQLGRAYAQYLLVKKSFKNPKITLGYDARKSCIEIRAALARGLVESGVRVVNIGLVTSPISYFTTFYYPDISGAIMITGSHNPPEYNGFKISVGKQTIFGEELQALKRIIESGNFVSGVGSEESLDVFPDYLKRYSQEFGQMKPVKVVLDCGNGAAGCIVRKLFHSVGLEPLILFEKPDGTFPNHHPDPTVEKNLKDLVKAVKETGALCGIGFDGDADRIGIVDHTGKMIYGDELMVILSRGVLSSSPGAKIIGDVKCSDRLFADIKKGGGQPIMWKTGHSLIKEKIKIESAPFGGEMSGHVFFADRNYGFDDALYAALRLCEQLSKTQKNIHELLAGLPSAFNTPEIRVDTTEEKKILIVEKLKDAFKEGPDSDFKVNLTDGVRISFPNGWALARSSNTQPVLVLRYESDTANGLSEIKNKIEAVVNKYL